MNDCIKLIFMTTSCNAVTFLIYSFARMCVCVCAMHAVFLITHNFHKKSESKTISTCDGNPHIHREREREEQRGTEMDGK